MEDYAHAVNLCVIKGRSAFSKNAGYASATESDHFPLVCVKPRKHEIEEQNVTSINLKPIERRAETVPLFVSYRYPNMPRVIHATATRK